MGVLSWDKPKRAIPVEEWKAISADSAPPGVYSPNMSDEDRLRWKAKKIGGKDPRVEIRKTVVGTPRKSKHGPWDNTSYAQVLLIVRPFPDGSVIMSMNGTAEFSDKEFAEMVVGVREAKLALTTHNGPPPQIGGRDQMTNRDRTGTWGEYYDAAEDYLRSTGQLDANWSPVGMKP